MGRRSMLRRGRRRGRRRGGRRTRRRIRRRTVLLGGMVVLAASGTNAAIKMSQEDAQRIEQHTGMPPADLDDNDLNEAMNELNIQGQPASAQDKAALSAEASTPAAAPVAGPPAPAAAAESASVADEIEKLADLTDRGIITDDDFTAGKNKLLGL